MLSHHLVLHMQQLDIQNIQYTYVSLVWKWLATFKYKLKQQKRSLMPKLLKGLASLA